MKTRLLNILCGFMFLVYINANCQNIPNDLIYGKGHKFQYVYRGYVGDDLSTFQPYDKIKPVFLLINDNPKFDEYCIEMTFGGSGSREKYQIKNTRTMLQNGDRWIVYETSNIEGKSISFIIDPNFRSVIYVSGNMQAIFTNTPKSEWE